ncbi:MAG: hypothetical protein ABSG51_03015, partial [Terracidiphilus sp.]
MSEPPPISPDSSASPSPSSTARPSRLRRFFFRHLPLSLAALAALLVAAAIGLYFFLGSTRFENFVRERLIAHIEQVFGGRVEIASFHWDLLNLEADADGLVIHGLEAPGEAPYARIDRLRVRFYVLDILSPHILLRDLDISRPQFHLIVYPDGTTNQPHPRRPAKPANPSLDTLFDAKAGHVSIEQGVLDYENRATTFDFQNRFALLDLQATDVSLLLRYIAATPKIPGISTATSPPAASPSEASPESYRIEAAAADLNLSRDGEQPVHGHIQATLDLTRSAVYLRSLRLTTEAHSKSSLRSQEHTLEISGKLDNFAQPRWQAKIAGDLDMEMLEPIFGYSFAPEGIARLDLDSAGVGGEFRSDGSVHVDRGSYIGTGVVATGVGLDAHVHADPRQLLISSIVARLRQGGQLEGEVDLNPWLPIMSSSATMRNPGIAVIRAPADRNPSTLPRPAPIIIPVNGKVTARFKDVALDTLLDMVGQRPFQRLGLDTRINGPATAKWSHGDTATLEVGALFNLSPSAQPAAAEVPAFGTVDATYTQRDGAVDLRKLELHTLASELEAHGRLGAYPLSSPSGISIEFHSHNLWEFDTVLRDLHFTRYGKFGVAALPVALAGQGDFQGSWTGSLVDPHLAGSLKATQISIEMVPVQPVQLAQIDRKVHPKPLAPQTSQPQFIHWDTIQATGSYTASRITILHGQMQRGKSEISFDGTLDSSPGRQGVPAFDANSSLHLHARADKVAIEDVLPLTGQNLPIAGTLDAMAQLDGSVHALVGSGWVQLDGGSAYGEPIASLRAQGTLANQVVKLASITVNDEAGKVSATGSYNLKSRLFQLDAKGAGIDVGKIESL